MKKDHRDRLIVRSSFNGRAIAFNYKVIAVNLHIINQSNHPAIVCPEVKLKVMSWHAHTHTYTYSFVWGIRRNVEVLFPSGDE